jgi:hypothetical protein
MISRTEYDPANGLYTEQSNDRLLLGLKGSLNEYELVPGEFLESRGDWSLVQPSTVPPPPVRIETHGCHRSGNSRFWQASFQPSMRSMDIIVMLKIEQLRLEIGGGPA